MKIFVAATYELLSKQAADEVTRIMQSRKHPLICPASGDSPAGLYKELVKRANSKKLNTSDWFFVGLDEWIGLNADDEGSCLYHLNAQLFHPLKISEERICFFNGRVNDLDAECKKTENFILQHGGIDVAILGVGMNGHVGMNEPGTSANTFSHVIDLDSTTAQVGQKYFKKQQTLKQGITLGIASLMEAKNLIVLISGKHKAGIAEKIIKSDVSEKLPATLLRNHPSLTIYLDKEAAANIA
jgi:galactosamine-6-phosphate isomerase